MDSSEMPIHLRYAMLYQQKRALLDKKSEIDVELKKITAELLGQTAQTDFLVSPATPEEVSTLGNFGSVSIKEKTENENITKTSLSALCVKFFTSTMPNSSPEELSRIGIGQSEWMWSNRNTKRVRYVERVFLDQKRKRPADGDDNPRSKKKKPVDADIPKTTEDFQKIAALAASSNKP